MKTKTLEGRFHTYNKRSRTLGIVASILAFGITIIGFYIWGRLLHYGDYAIRHIIRRNASCSRFPKRKLPIHSPGYQARISD